MSLMFRRLLGATVGGGGGPNPGDGTVDPGGIFGDYEWWASDLTALADGDPVAGGGVFWNRHSGAAVASDLGNVSGLGVPTLRFDATGVRVVRFVKSHSDGLGLTTTTGAGARSIYAIIKLAGGDVGTILGATGTGGLQFRANGPFPGNIARLNILRSGSTQAVLGATTIGTIWRLVEGHTNETSSHQVVLDGVVDGSSSSAVDFGVSNRVGASSTGEYLDGDIAALVVADSMHNSTQQAAMRARLHTAFSLLIGP